jgi:TetR/AcrR family transcriptional regulator of autoinduction and epiphytic fitness
MGSVNRPQARRTRRAERAEQTRRRILESASVLFIDRGYAATTIEAIAAHADVAVETVYSRFRSKAGVLDAILAPAITGDEETPVLDRPELAAIRAMTDQREQLRRLAHVSRTILQRTDQIHRILHTAAAADPSAAELERRDRQHRWETQRAFIDMLLGNGSLRPGLTPAHAADTYAALANPDTYAFLTRQRNWSPEWFEEWLGDSLTRVLLP